MQLQVSTMSKKSNSSMHKYESMPVQKCYHGKQTKSMQKELWGEANKVFMYHPSCDFRFSQNLLDGVVHLDYHLVTLKEWPETSG